MISILAHRSLRTLPLILCGALATAAVRSQEPPDRAYETERAAILELKSLYERAVNEVRPSLIEPRLHERFTGVVVTGEQVEGFKGLSDYWEKMKTMIGAGGRYTLKIVPAEKVSIFGDLALAHGTTENNVVTGAGKEYHFASRWTGICKKQDGQWKILRIHDSMDDPIGNEFVAATISGAKLVTGAGAGAAGLVLGALVTVLLRRRRG